MPSRLPQCLGVGFGPGYHAPIVLGPRWKSQVERHGVVRLPHAPAPPPACCGFGAPSMLHVDAGWSPSPAPARPASYATPAIAPASPVYPAPTAAPRLAPPREPASPSDTPTPEPLPIPPR